MDGKREQNPLIALIKEHDIEAVSFIGTDFHGIARGKHIPAARLVENPATSVNISSYMLMTDCQGMPHPSPTPRAPGLFLARCRFFDSFEYRYEGFDSLHISWLNRDLYMRYAFGLVF